MDALHLPPELRELIALQLPFEERATLLSVSRAWRDTVSAMRMWRGMPWSVAADQRLAVAARTIARAARARDPNALTHLLHLAVRDGQDSAIRMLIGMGARPLGVARYRSRVCVRGKDVVMVLGAVDAVRAMGRRESIEAFRAAGTVISESSDARRPHAGVVLLVDPRCAETARMLTTL